MICSTIALNALLILGPPISINCDVISDKPLTIKRDLLIQKDNITVDCNKGSTTNVIIQSPLINNQFKPVKNVTIKNCSLSNIRVTGIGLNGQSKNNLDDSRINPNHTKYAQSVAPNNITISNNKFTTDGIKIYLGPGINNVTIENNTILGSSDSVGIYLDAESGFNTIRNNTIAVKTKSREQIALDGSAYNLISNNNFSNLSNGGIFLYRNCGEGGAIRFQTPSFNRIENNNFTYNSCSSFTCKPGIWVSSRMRKYIKLVNPFKGIWHDFCDEDKGYHPNLNTSSTNDNDNASDNIIINNEGIPSYMIMNTEFEYKNTIKN
jgi:parallel beta-helix repeat protein